MKIGNRNFEVLDKLEKNSIGNVGVLPDDQNFILKNCDSQQYYFQKNCNYFKQSINLISNSFQKAVETSKHKLHILLKEIDTLKLNGTYIYDSFTIMISSDLNNENSKICLYYFSNKNILLGIFIQDIEDDFNLQWISSAFNQDPILFSELLMKISFFELFKKYAEVETKILPPKSNKIYDKEKYINETSLTITYLDSKWFTNLVKSDSFKVSGHFRLQPKKVNDKWTKELIWISDFTKNGYASRAKIES